MSLPARWPVVLFSAGVMVLAAFATAPAPARADTGEKSIERAEALTITYNDVKNGDVLWWEWEVVGGSPNVSFWVWRGSFREFCNHYLDSQRTLHNESGTGSSGRVDLRNDDHTVVVWSHNSTQNATVRYQVGLSPQMTLVNSALAVLMLVPVVAILVLMRRDRLRKRETDSGPAGK